MTTDQIIVEIIINVQINVQSDKRSQTHRHTDKQGVERLINIYKLAGVG